MQTTQETSGDEMIRNLFKPSVMRSATAVLDRAAFAKTIPAAAASVSAKNLIMKYRRDLEKSHDLLRIDRIPCIVAHPDQVLAAQGQKCLLLNPNIKPEQPETWSPVLREAVDKAELGVMPYEVQLDYDFFGLTDVLTAILPEELLDEIPSGFNTAGHVAHLNLRDAYVPYKKLIGQVILDKTPNIRTVINKVDNVGTESQFRTFAYEVLAGPDDLLVEVNENNCTFSFDYAKVYWNSKLEPEHTRLIKLFQSGEVVCDVMAGIGPFAVPAGKKGVFVWANDMNPESYKYLQDSIARNKVGQYVRPFCKDGRDFIHMAADAVYAASAASEHALVHTKTRRHDVERPPPQKVPVPPTISHFVMNLPASATEFVHHYRGLYAGREHLFEPHTATKLPLVHVHCFALKSDDEVPLLDICERLSKELGVALKPGNAENPDEVGIYDVRDVAPAKRMFCASFRVPREVAFAPRTA
jgi:tRNA (guanine37-N1)-methyltransferase